MVREAPRWQPYANALGKSGGETKQAWIADYFDQAGKRHQMAFKTKKQGDRFLVGPRHGAIWTASQSAGEAPSTPAGGGRDIPRKEHLQKMIGAAKGRWRAFVITSIFTGLRASELRGLRWADVDLDASFLSVRQRADRWNAIGSPKTHAAKRDVPLAPMVVNALREWHLA